MRGGIWLFVLLTGMGALISTARAEQLTVAVASNFAPVMKAIVPSFEQQTGHQVKLIFASSGKIYAQIRHGAPYDMFFSADQKTPQALERDGETLSGSRLTYAIGRLTLWSPKTGLALNDGQILADDQIKKLAIANPRLAPYGLAAQEVLQALGLWDKVTPRLVRGENIAQTYHFVSSSNADLGFVALSQVRQNGAGTCWIIPDSLYSPLRQDAVILKHAGQNPAAPALLAYLQQPDVRRTLKAFGYRLPETKGDS
tara:strand:- start:3719 stop:4486 length:768 start_codon:yes stop_codon:yes gene_type:complete